MMERKAGVEDLHDGKRRLKTAYTQKTNKQTNKKAKRAKNPDKHKVFMFDHNVL